MRLLNSVSKGLVLASSAIVGAYCVCRVLSRQSHLSVIPTPKGSLPIVGHVLTIDKQKPHLTLSKWSEELGGLYCFSAYGTEYVVISDMELVEELQTDSLSKARASSGTREGIFNNHMLSDNLCPRHLLMRELFLSHIKTYGSGISTIAMVVTSHHIQKIQEQLGAGHCDVQENLTDLFCDISEIIIFGGKKQSSEARQKLHRMIQLLSDDPVYNQFMFSSLPWIVGPSIKHIEEMEKLSRNIFEELKCSMNDLPESAQDTNLFCKMMRVADSDNIEGFDEDYVEGNIWLLLVPGCQWLVQTVLQLFTEVAGKADVQQEMREEVGGVVGSRRRLQQADIRSLAYHHAVITEAHRHLSLIPLSIYKVKKSFTVHGCELPAGTPAILNLWHLLHNASHFPDAHTFKPERFLDDKGALLSNTHPYVRLAQLAFGTGERVCAAKHLVDSSLIPIVAMLIREFEFLQSSDSSQLKGNSKSALFEIRMRTKIA